MKGPTVKGPTSLVGTPPTTEQLAAAISDHLARAKADLYARMMIAGLTIEKGWRISEKLVQTIGGTLWTFSPIHSREASPDMATSVLIDDQGRVVGHEMR